LHHHRAVFRRRQGGYRLRLVDLRRRLEGYRLRLVDLRRRLVGYRLRLVDLRRRLGVDCRLRGLIRLLDHCLGRDLLQGHCQDWEGLGVQD
jgi:hypothetical protein